LHNHVGDSSSDDSDRRDKSSNLGSIFSCISMFDHGYLKVKRDLDGYQVHLTWTWTVTRAAGSYVYVRVDGSQLLEGMTTLARKILEVDEGSRVPTKDKRRT
jgi:hypothetical protein